MNTDGTPYRHSSASERPLSRWEFFYKYAVFEAGDSAWSLIVVSTYFSAFLQVGLKETGVKFGWAVTTAAFVSAVLSPILGASADHSGRRQPYLRLFVLGAVLAVHPGTSLRLGAHYLADKLLFALSAAPLAGFGLAGVWSSSRVLLTALTPAEKSGSSGACTTFPAVLRASLAIPHGPSS